MDIYEHIRNYKIDDGITSKFLRLDAASHLTKHISNLRTTEGRKEFIKSLPFNLDPLSKHQIISGADGYFI